MTTQQINERIALLCGWTVEVEDDPEDGEMNVWTSPCGKEHFTGPGLYSESLDKCREFELTLKDSDTAMSEYGCAIEDAVNAGDTGWGYIKYMAICATPLQRCEAFLRMKGQWDEN